MKIVNKRSTVDPALEAILGALKHYGTLVQFMGRLGSEVTRKQIKVNIKTFSGLTLAFELQVFPRLTPRIVLNVIRELTQNTKHSILVVFAPTISVRVAELLRTSGFNYLDQAGNCLIQSRRIPLYIERQGFEKERGITPAAADPFSQRSSRIVRTLLTEPMKYWQVRELAKAAKVSLGLVVKVKRTLIEEGYVFEHDRHVNLRDPVGLIEAWAANYSGPVEQYAYYVHGELQEIEKRVSQWCLSHGIPYGLAGFSAAWQLAPEVRHQQATFYFDEDKQSPNLFKLMCDELGGRPVNSGANLQIWLPYDSSVITTCREVGSVMVTSPVQTYLDVKKLAGRGEEAAQAIFDKYLKKDMEAAAQRAQEWQRGNT